MEIEINEGKVQEVSQISNVQEVSSVVLKCTCAFTEPDSSYCWIHIVWCSVTGLLKRGSVGSKCNTHIYLNKTRKVNPGRKQDIPNTGETGLKQTHVTSIEEITRQ